MESEHISAGNGVIKSQGEEYRHEHCRASPVDNPMLGPKCHEETLIVLFFCSEIKIYIRLSHDRESISCHQTTRQCWLFSSYHMLRIPQDFPDFRPGYAAGEENGVLRTYMRTTVRRSGGAPYLHNV